MIGTVFLREFSQLLLKHGASLEDILNMVYSQDELDPKTGKYKKYFDLISVNRNPQKYPEGYSYKIRYRIDLSGKKIPQGRATYTTKTAIINEAVKLGFDNRLEVLKNYELNKGKPKGGNGFYKMLNDYYADGSRYLEDDNVNNKREVVHKSRKEARAFIKKDLLPYLQEKKIRNINEITTSVYSGLKIYLQAKGIKDKTINNRLNYLIRIFEYHLRNGLLEKLPYSKGTSLLRLTGNQEIEDAELLPIEKLKSVYQEHVFIDPLIILAYVNRSFNTKSFGDLSVREQKIIFDNYTLPYTLGVLALNTGMRNSEIARVKRSDFISVQERKTFLLKVWNNKTNYFNKTNESKYRKIPLHSFTIAVIKDYIKKKEALYDPIAENGFLFGNEMENKDTGELDGNLHYRVFDKAVLLILKLIKHKKEPASFFSTENEFLKNIQNTKALQEELKDEKDAGKGISFYSFRKTFRTMLGLNNDLAEYYMGHKLGDNSKTTYIRVNSLDNSLFVDEYAEPVISMLDKYIFYTKEDVKKEAKEIATKNKRLIDFMHKQFKQGVSMQDATIAYEDMEQKESEKAEKTNLVENGGYFSKM